MTPAHRVPLLAAVLVGTFNVACGLWIIIEPKSFYDVAAPFPPYNPHFLRDGGAFQVGLGVAIPLACRVSDALLVALAAATVASWLHVASHIMDRELGGHPTIDIVGLTAVAAVATAGTVARYAAIRRAPG